MSKSKIFIGICISFAAGIWLASYFNIPREFVYIAAAVFIAVFAVFFNAKRRLAPLLAFFLFAAALGALRLQTSQVPNEFAPLFGGKQKLEGYIVEDVDIRTDKQLVTFRPKGHGENILATLPKTQDYFYGDWIVAEGKVMEARSSPDFDYQKYLERFGVYATMSYPKILILKSHQLSRLKESLLKIKFAFAARISRFLTEPQASLLMGILIGARRTLPQNVTDNFNLTGVSHIIAISGYNISIIIKALEYLAKLFGRRFSFWLSLLVILGFVILSGASASVIRAAMMGGLLLLAFNIGRQYSISPALFFAALIMLIINPKILFWDVGFQLSFAATAGIVYFCPLLDRLTINWPNPLQLKSIFLTTMAAIVATLPLILLNFGRLSLVAPLVNILLLPLIPFITLAGFAIALPIVGAGFAYVCNLPLIYILKVTSFFAQFHYSSLQLQISSWMFVLLAVFVVALYFLLKRAVSGKQLADDPHAKLH